MFEKLRTQSQIDFRSSFVHEGLRLRKQKESNLACQIQNMEKSRNTEQQTLPPVRESLWLDGCGAVRFSTRLSHSCKH